MANTKLIAGNWKMNGLSTDGLSRAKHIADFATKNKSDLNGKADILLAPPATLISALHDVTKPSPVFLGGQDCHPETSGAFTGDLSAEMLKDAGCSYIITGHSERRAIHGETDELVSAKTAATHRAGMTAVVCVGETAVQRQAGEAEKTVKTQITQSLPDTILAGNTVIAYEPVWAIGTGLTATIEDIEAMHGFIRNLLEKSFPVIATTHLLYGGSVKGANAAQILSCANVDGVLVGGASLNGQEFCDIIAAAL
ncbi:MAG: triose-phosphate isomerase [Alphaproteobacteria bacterium]|nr:MAG: triose-phosphate isomerase [Alphaproteobacteria bacterium]